MKALLSHHSCVSPWWVYKGKGKNWIVTVQRNIPFIEIFGAQWEVGGRDDRKNKKMLKGWDNLLVPVFYNISALVPVELNLENCIYITELGGCSHTSVLPPSSIYRVPCLAPGTPQSRETLCTHPGEAVRTLPSTSGLFSAIFKLFSPSFRSEGEGGSVWLYLWPWQLFTSRDSWVTNI